ncbi:MAG TPA: deoxyribose-phosphate aldolase [Candidatus Hydrogenedentes bacterium]|nr:deoxyribose-phosphate aldolase [Candidatus Hydrogenedentota bacterium]HPG66035.1 deoxyribose-phosphate aldolase [Candidatus Hydrogenedentota bacterium]
MNRSALAAMIDHTLLRADASQNEVARLCDEAVQFGFAAVAISPCWTVFCADRLMGTSVAVDPTIGFPLGANTTSVKVAETREAVANGAREIDMVINIGALKSGLRREVEGEIAAVVTAASGRRVKVIIEACFLTAEEKVAVCEMCLRAGAAFVKTSTGFAPAGATVEDVALLSRTVGGQVGVKAAGGIRTYEDAMAMIAAGATRIGSSRGIAILAGVPGHEQ